MAQSPITTGPLTSAAFCWRLERRDGAGVALTSHDKPLLRDGIRYVPSPGMVPAAVVRRAGLEPQSSEIDGAISDEALTDEDLELGRWDGARVNLSAIDWSGELADELTLIGGEIDTVATSNQGFTAELIGTAARLEEAACPDTSPECRAQLGDRQCRVDLSARRSAARLAAHDGNRLTVNPAPGDELVGGDLQVVSGNMTGFRSPILGVEGDEIILRDPPRGAIEAGDRLWLTEGCDKRFATCADRFGNAVNFRGEPHLPGNDLLTRYPGA